MKRILFVILAITLSLSLSLQGIISAEGNLESQSVNQSVNPSVNQSVNQNENQNENQSENQSESQRKFLVKYKEGKPGYEQKNKGKTNFKKIKNKNLYSIDASTEDLKNLQEDKDIETIEKDGQVKKLNDKITWNIDKINSPKVQMSGFSGEGIKVAIFDTGIDTQNTDLNVVGGVSFVEGVESYDDDNGHGTAIAGILSALKNDQGYLGAAPGINLYSVKVLDQDGNGTYGNIIEGKLILIE